MKQHIWILSLALAGCAVGPDYQKPEVPTPTQFREAMGADAALVKRWQPVAAAETKAPTGDWWKTWWNLPDDSELAQALSQIAKANPNVAMVAAQFRQADAALSGARAPWWPSLTGNVSSSRGTGVAGSTTAAGSPVRITDKVSVAASWEIDLWGRIGRAVEGNKATLEASLADWQAAILSAQAAYAQAWLQWQANRQQQALLDATVKAYARTLEITRSRYEAGVISKVDVLQAETQFNSTRAQALDLGIQQAQLAHAMAVLLGKAPAEFTPPSVTGLPELPVVPAVLPSQLLLARPDVAAAERRVAAANAQIGVAQAAWFPTLTLGASGGYQDNTFKDIISAPNRFWSIGPSLALSLFDGGARSAAKAQAVAATDQKVASYRQTVLTAFQEVEDQLAATRILAAEEEAQRMATEAARQALRLSEHQYAAGTIAYLNVLTAQTSALSAERTLLSTQLSRALAGIALIKAVGGGWDGKAPPVTPQK